MTTAPLPPSATALGKRKEEHDPGSGHVHLVPGARFATSRASYPLKLLSPAPLPSQPANLATCYTLAYGGGLVAGDVISLRVEVDEGCGLVMLTQGSTKVFKKRPGLRPKSHLLRSAHTADDDESSTATTDHWTVVQRLHVRLEPNSMLVLMPDSVSPFRDSRYAQAQRFVLPSCGTASLLVLDWVNSGRGQKQGYANASDEREVWSMARYASTNEVLVGDKVVMRERMILENDNLESGSTPTPAEKGKGKLLNTARHLAPYNVYATILILGPLFAPLLEHLRKTTEAVQQFQLHRPQTLTWSYSPVEEGRGGVLRIAAVEVEDVRVWMREHLDKGGVRQLVGDGLWPRVL